MIMAVSMICVHTSLSLYLVHVWSVTNDHRCLCDLRSVFVGIAGTSEPVSRVWLPVARLVCSTIALHLIWDNTCSGHGQVIWRLSHLHLETSHQYPLLLPDCLNWRGLTHLPGQFSFFPAHSFYSGLWSWIADKKLRSEKREIDISLIVSSCLLPNLFQLHSLSSTKHLM